MTEHSPQSRRQISRCVRSAFVAVLLSPLAFAQQATEPVRSGCEVDYPPFCIVHEDGRADGFAVELLRAALAKMGRDVTFRTGPWEEVRGWLERDEIDALPLVGRTPEREELFDFTIPYMTMRGAIVVRADTTGIHTLADLHGRTVGVMHADNAEEFLRRKERGIDILTTPTFSAALQALARRRCDAVVMQRLVAIRLLEETGLGEALRIVKQPITGFAQDFCFAVTEGDRETLALLNEGLALCMADGTHRRLHAKWFAHLQLPTDRPIVVGGDHNYPPFEFLDEKGRPAGYNVDLIRAVAEAAGLDIRVRLGSWSEMMDALDRGEIDAMQGMFYSPERDRKFDFTQAHIVIHCVSVVRAGGGKPPSSADELRGERIVVQEGDIMHDFCLEHGLTDRLVAVDAQEDALRELAAGEHDCALVARMTAFYLAEREGWDNLVIGQTPLKSADYCFAVPEGDRALLAQLGEGLTVIADSGEYRRIHEEWMGVYGDHFMWDDVLKYVVMVAAPLLGVALLALLWSWSLRKQVARRTAEIASQSRLLQAAAETARFGGWSVDLQTNIVTWSDVVCDIHGVPHGYSPKLEEGIGFYAPEWREKITQVYTACAEDGIPYDEEMQILASDGSRVWVRAAGRAIKSRRGEIVKVEGSFQDVSRQKEAEAALRRSEAAYRQIAERTVDCIWVMDMDLTFTYVNPAVKDLFGYTEDEFLGTRLPEHCDEDHFRQMQAVITAHVTAGPGDASTTFETVLRAKNGREVPVEINGTVVFDEQGNPAALQGVTRDISERKQYEARLHHLLQVLRAVRNVNQLITHENAQDTLLHRACDILTATRGYRSAWIGLLSEDRALQPFAESGIGDDFNAFAEHTKAGSVPECCRRALECNEPVVMRGTQENCKSCPLTCTHRDAAALAHALRHEERDYGVIVVALPTDMADDEQEQSLFAELAGDIGYALYGIETERDRQRSEAKAERLARFPSENPHPVLRITADGIVEYANEAAAPIASDITDDGGSRLLPDWRRQVDDALQSGQKVGVEIVSGSRTFQATLAPVTNQGYLNVYARDVTRFRALEAQLRQAQKMEAVGRLAGGVAHDYNNIVMGILGYADLCREGIDSDHPIRQLLDEITTEAQRSANLTRQLLAFARKQTIAPQVVHLNDAVVNMLKMLRRLIGEDIDLTWEPGAALWPVYIDPGQVDQVLANLCVNARDAIEGTGNVTIETENVTIDADYCAEHEGFKPGDFTMLAVSDDGCGMDRDALEHIFEPFYTTKGVGEGTGLGLATVYGIVKQNDGFVNAYSEPEKGTTFRIYFPRFAGAGDKDADREKEMETVGGNETILLVEDEKSIRRTMRLFLEKLGYTVLATENPEKARRLASDHGGPIDLLITDVVMPGMSGRELAENLTADHPDMRVLYMSGYTANVIAHRGVLEDNVDFLSKPIPQNQLARKVREILDRA